jgi:hypothetical protein
MATGSGCGCFGSGDRRHPAANAIRVASRRLRQWWGGFIDGRPGGHSFKLTATTYRSKFTASTLDVDDANKTVT